MEKLKNKVAVITGGNSGIGRATAILFAKEGAKVMICARRQDKLDQVVREIEELGGEAAAVSVDIALPESAELVINKCVERFGRVDILINNAGRVSYLNTSIERELDTEIVKNVMDVNAMGAFYMIRAAVPHMLEQGKGAIVNVASVAGSHGLGGASYAASKGALIGITRHTAVMHTSHGIRCNAVCPGGVNTPLVAPSFRGEGIDLEAGKWKSAHMDTSVAMAEPEDLAANILFFASDDAKNITGQVLVCDFGSSL